MKGKAEGNIKNKPQKVLLFFPWINKSRRLRKTAQLNTYIIGGYCREWIRQCHISLCTLASRPRIRTGYLLSITMPRRSAEYECYLPYFKTDFHPVLFLGGRAVGTWKYPLTPPSPPSSAKAMNARSCNSTSTYTIMT